MNKLIEKAIYTYDKYVLLTTCYLIRKRIHHKHFWRLNRFCLIFVIVCIYEYYH